MAKCKCPRKDCIDRNCPHREVHDNRETCDIRCYKHGAKGLPCKNIIPAKNRKPRIVRVKAWAWLYPDGELCAATVAKCASRAPCTITIEAKHLKEGK